MIRATHLDRKVRVVPECTGLIGHGEVVSTGDGKVNLMSSGLADSQEAMPWDDGAPRRGVCYGV